MNFHGLAPMRNTCVYVVLVPFLVCSHSQVLQWANHVVISRKLRLHYSGLKTRGNLRVLGRSCRVDGVTTAQPNFVMPPESSNVCGALRCY